jgi:hypothetical protein
VYNYFNKKKNIYYNFKMLYKKFINCFKDGNIKQNHMKKGDNDVYFIHFTNTTDANKKQSKIF